MIKINDLPDVENLDEAEQRKLRGTGFAAWLKNRTGDSSEAEEWADDEAEEQERAPDTTDSTGEKPSDS